MKNKYQHNDDGTTHIFVETKNKYFPGKHTIIIDTEDWDKVKEYKWHISGSHLHHSPYAQAGVKLATGKETTLKLHHLIMGKPKKGMVTDHIEHNGLDNRKENLRFVTHAQNAQNRGSNKKASSQYKGVCWVSQKKKWKAQAGDSKAMGRGQHIGYFTCEHEAALAYNKRALELWGEHVLLNEVGPIEHLTNKAI